MIEPAIPLRREPTEGEMILLRTVDLMSKIDSTDAGVETDVEFAEMMARGWK
jgi:hypothetical protein